MSRFYRNTATLYLDNKEIVDEGSLWARKGDVLILVDEDRYIEHDITTNFTAVDE